MLRRVAIYSSKINPRTTEVITRLVNEFCPRGINIQLHERAGDFQGCPRGSTIERFTDLKALSALPDLVLSVGGDGTFLEAMTMVKDFDVPVAGINTGRLGFLANISEEEIKPALEMIYNGNYGLVERSLLQITDPADLFNGSSSFALNEVTIQKADLNMITISVYIDGVHLNTYWADGLIISTATGSTAYNLSAGGPILSPEDESIIISPISPHNLSIRPIVVSGDSNLKLEVETRGCEYLATCDFRFTRVPNSRGLNISRAPGKLKTVMLGGRDFYSTLRNKLMWGADKRN